MAETSPYDIISPGFSAQQARLGYQQMLAQQLMANGMQAPQGQMVGPVYVKPSPIQNVSRLAQMLMGERMMRNSFDQQAKLAQALYGQPQGATAAPQAAPQGAAMFGMGQPQTNQVQPQQGQPGGTAAQAMGGTGPLEAPGPGMSQQNKMLYVSDPKSYMTAYLAQQAPTPDMRTLMAAGVQPGTPEYQAAMAKLALKAGYIAPVEQREGSVERDPITNQVIGLNPKLPQGSVPIYNNSGQLQGAGMAPGAAQAIQQANQSEALGKTLGSVQNVTNASGAVVPMLGSQLFGNGQSGAGTSTASAPNAPPGAAPQAAAAHDFFSDMPKIETPKGIGQTTIQKGFDDARVEAFKRLNEKYGTESEAANNKMALNNQILDLVDKADTGKGAAVTGQVKSWLVKMGIPEGDFENTPSADQALQKDLTNLATQSAKSQFGAKITQAETMLMLSKASPNMDMTKAAIKFLVNSDNKAQQYLVDRSNDFNTAMKMGGDPTGFEPWYSKKKPLRQSLDQVKMDAGAKYVETRIAPDGRKLGRTADGKIEVIQ